MNVDIKPAILAEPSPTRRECHLYSIRFPGAELAEDIHSKNGTLVLRGAAWLLGYRDRDLAIYHGKK